MKPFTFFAENSPLVTRISCLVCSLFLGSSALAQTNGTWITAGNYTVTNNWTNGIIASGIGATATVTASGSFVVNTNATLGSFVTSRPGAGQSIFVSGSGATLTLALSSGTPSWITGGYYSSYDYIANLTLAGNQGITVKTGSDVLVYQSGTVNSLTGTVTQIPSGNDGNIAYAQGNSVLASNADLVMQVGNETNGYGNAVLVLNGGSTNTIGALSSTTNASYPVNAYIGTYAGQQNLGPGSAPSGTNVNGTNAWATLVIGNTGNSATFAGNLGVGWSFSASPKAIDTNHAAANAALSIVKVGTGAQTFSGANAYSGTTTINGGSLLVTGTHTAVAVASTDAGNYVVGSASTLGGTGTITPSGTLGSNTMIAISGTLAPGVPGVNNGIGTLTLNGTNSINPLLSFTGGGTLSYDLGAGLAGDEVVIVNGRSKTVTFSNTAINFNDPTSGALTSGAYVLFHSDASGSYAGLTTNGSGSITAGLSIGSGLGYYPGSGLQMSNNDIVLNLTPSAVAGTPAGVTNTVSGTNVTVSWGTMANAVTYIVYRSSSPNGTYATVGTTTNTSYADTNAANGTTYYYKVAAENAATNGVISPASAAVSGTPLNLNTLFVVGVHLRAYSTYGMAVTDIAGVIHAPYWNNFLGPQIQGETTSMNALTDQNGNPVSGLSISWTAGSTTTGAYANSGTVKLGNDAVTTPPTNNDLNLLASAFDQFNGTASTLTVTGIPYANYDVLFYMYDDPAGPNRGGSITIGTNSYYLRGGAGQANTNGVGYIQSDATSLGSGTNVVQGNYVRFSGLSSNSFTASLVAQNMGDSTQRLKVAGFQILSHDAVATPTNVPTTPAGLSASGGNRQVALNWNASSTATSYKIYRGTSSGSLAALSGGTVTAPVTSYADITAVNGTPYYYAVSAVNGVGEGTQSSQTNATPAVPSFTAPTDTVYQWSLPMTPVYSGTNGTKWPYDTQRRAYLWVPPNCTKVQGVMVGLHNMLEKPMFDDPGIRQACIDANLAILFIAPGDATKWTPNGVGNYTPGAQSTAITLDPNNYQSQDINPSTGTNYTTDINPVTGTRFANQSEQAAAELTNMLSQFAALSGYSEIQYAPLLLTDHSAGSPFCWGRTVPSSAALTGRVFAIIPNKGTYPGNISNLLGIPILHISSEWQEISDWGNTWEIGDAPQLRTLRAGGTNCLLGECVQPGTGHYEYAPEQVTPVADFIRAVASARIPSNWPATNYPPLNTLPPSSGWVVDARTMGSGTCVPVSYTSWTHAGNDPLRSYWYPDQITAQDVCNTANAGFAKKPQMINAFQGATNTTPYALNSAYTGGSTAFGYVPCSPTLQGDGITFQVRAASVNQSPIARLNNAAPLGMATGSIQFRANGSGSMKQTSVDTFRVWLERESLIKGGQPWEPFILAYHPGDTNYRSAYRPIQITTAVAVNQISGTTNTISFSTIPDVTGTNLPTITLTNATASSGLPVQYWVASGPFISSGTNGEILIPDTVPPGTKFPMPVVIGAWQWGRPSSAGSAVQSAQPVFQTFYINQTALNNWRYTNFGTYTNSGSAADTSNPTGDGIVNLMKYATAMSPAVNSGSNRPAIVGISGSGTNAYQTLTFNRIADPAVTYTVEASTNLGSGIWTPVWSSTGSSNTAGSVVVPDSATISQQPQRFLRLKVTH